MFPVEMGASDRRRLPHGSRRRKFEKKAATNYGLLVVTVSSQVNPPKVALGVIVQRIMVGAPMVQDALSSARGSVNMLRTPADELDGLAGNENTAPVDIELLLTNNVQAARPGMPPTW